MLWPWHIIFHVGRKLKQLQCSCYHLSFLAKSPRVHVRLMPHCTVAPQLSKIFDSLATRIRGDGRGWLAMQGKTRDWRSGINWHLTEEVNMCSRLVLKKAFLEFLWRLTINWHLTEEVNVQCSLSVAMMADSWCQLPWWSDDDDDDQMNIRWW